MTVGELELLDRRLLDALQGGLPLVADPFAELASRLGADADELVQRTARLKEQGVIRQVSAIFDTAALGYVGSLVAARFEPGRIGDGAAVINRHPGVSHNYRRNHDYNLWFTLAVPPTSRLGLARTVEVLAGESGALAVRLLPAIRVFKIGVRLDMSGAGQVAPANRASADDENGLETCGPSGDGAGRETGLTERDTAAVRALQEELPIVRGFFDEPARRAGLGVDELLSAAGGLLASGRMRRLAAVLHHRAAGFWANAMGVWVVPGERVERVGRQMACFPAVSHCYQRPTYSDWPFSLFTMVHARSQAECESILAAIRRATSVEQMAALYSMEEYKKIRLRYFTGEIEAWEAEHG